MRHGAGQHDDLGVYDHITPAFIRYVLGCRRTMRALVLQLIAEHGPARDRGGGAQPG